MNDLTTGIWPNYGARTTIRERNSESLALDATLHQKVCPSEGRGGTQRFSNRATETKEGEVGKGADIMREVTSEKARQARTQPEVQCETLTVCRIH